MISNPLSPQRYGRFYRSARKYATRQDVLISAYLVLSIFTVAFFSAVFIRPTAVTIAKLWREINDKKDVNSQLEKKIRDLEDAQNLYSSIEDDLQYLYRALPSSPDFSRFVKQIEYLASLHGLQLASSNYANVEILSADSATPSVSELLEYQFSLTLNGTYSELGTFLADLERLDRIVTLHSVKISPESESVDEGSFVLTLNVDSSVYAFSEGVNVK